MDALRFDAWTRRRVGATVGGFAAFLLTGPLPPEAAAKKRKKKRCVKVGNPCRTSKKARRCCRGLACDVTPGGPGRFSCHRQRQTPCNNDRECCGDDVLCSKRNDDLTFLCRANLGAACGETADCGGVLDCDGGTCQLPPSDRALKTNFASIDPTHVLERVRDLPISTWSYTADDPSIRHLGPMAQDFNALFTVGADDRHIHPLDGQGVALAAIQGLLAQIDALQADNAQLAARVAALERPPTGVQCPPHAGIAREGHDVDGSRFDAWTRRRFGMATGGAAAAALLGLMGLADADARHKNKHDGNKNSNKNKNKNSKQCRKTGQSCDETKKKKKCCNKNELCAQVKGQGGDNRCCKQNGEGCKKDSDCCGNDRCDGRKCRLP